MDLSQLNFSYPNALWGLTLIPLVWVLYAAFYRRRGSTRKLKRFIDEHLIKHLLVTKADKAFSIWKGVILWSLIWVCLIVALAGPRWSYREVETFKSDQSLIIVLDLSQSMDADDVKPSRLVRAKQKIEDILAHAKGLRVGLIAFAADSHMITPLTEDVETIRHLLPSISTDLAFVQGSNLRPALEMAGTMFDMSPGSNKAVVVMSDGGFEDASALTSAKALAAKGVVLYAMAIGTEQGGPVRDKEGAIIRKEGAPVVTKLEKEKLIELSRIGRGRYLEAHYTADDEAVIVGDLRSRAEKMETMKQTMKLWDERFYFLLFPALPFVLLWLRRGYIIPLIIMMMTSSFGIQAAEIEQYFKNADQQGSEALQRGDYSSAAELFQDSYRKGVAEYRSGNYADAEELFRASERPEVERNAAYNLGNALVYQNKLQEAKKQYEEVVNRWPDFQNAKDNLELVKEMLKQQQQEQQSKDTGDEGEDQEGAQSDDSQNDQESDRDEDSENDQQQDSDHSENDDEDQSDSQDENPPQDQQEESDNDPQDSDGESSEPPEEPQDEEEDSSDQEADAEPPPPESYSPPPQKTMDDMDADQWLNRMSSDPKEFLKNKFYIESLRNGAKETADPW